MIDNQQLLKMLSSNDIMDVIMGVEILKSQEETDILYIRERLLTNSEDSWIRSSDGCKIMRYNPLDRELNLIYL